MELVLNAFRSNITELPNGHVMMKFQPLRRDDAGNMMFGDDGQPIPEGIPIVLVWTPEGLASFKENLMGPRGRIVMPVPGGPVQRGVNGG